MTTGRWIIAAIVLALCTAALVYGVAHGDVGYVLQNAKNFCFS